MKFNNPLNMAHALAAQRSLASVESQKSSGHLSTEAMQDKLNLAGDPGQSRLGFFNSLRARRHEAQESLETSNTVISFRESQIRSLATEAIEAQITLMRADLKQRFDCEFAVIAERGLAAFVQAQNSFYALVDAGCDQIYEGLHLRVQDLTARHEDGRFSDASFQNELVRAHLQAELQVKNLQTSCSQRIDSLNNAFNGG